MAVMIETKELTYTYPAPEGETNPPALRGVSVTIEKGSGIAQFRIMENQPKLNFVRVEHLDGPDRGGFGSTGKR